MAGVFACGNVLHVHDLVDFVSEEAAMAGKKAAKYIEELTAMRAIRTLHQGEGATEEEGGTQTQTANTRSEKNTTEAIHTDESRIDILPIHGIRYTVPAYIRPAHMEDTLTVRFRVGGVYKNCYIATYFDDELVMRRKRPVVAPGEMEEIKLSKEKLSQYPNLKTITIQIEEA